MGPLTFKTAKDGKIQAQSETGELSNLNLGEDFLQFSARDSKQFKDYSVEQIQAYMKAVEDTIEKSDNLPSRSRSTSEGSQYKKLLNTRVPTNRRQNDDEKEPVLV